MFSTRLGYLSEDLTHPAGRRSRRADISFGRASRSELSRGLVVCFTDQCTAILLTVQVLVCLRLLVALPSWRGSRHGGTLFGMNVQTCFVTWCYCHQGLFDYSTLWEVMVYRFAPPIYIYRGTLRLSEMTSSVNLSALAGTPVKKKNKSFPRT